MIVLLLLYRMTINILSYPTNINLFLKLMSPPLNLLPLVFQYPEQFPQSLIQDDPLMDDSLPLPLPRPFHSNPSPTQPTEKLIYADLGSIHPSDAPMKPPSMEEQKVIYSTLSHTLLPITTKSGTPPIPSNGEKSFYLQILNLTRVFLPINT